MCDVKQIKKKLARNFKSNEIDSFSTQLITSIKKKTILPIVF